MEQGRDGGTVLGPTPVKSSLSITSECWDAFLGRPVLPFARSTAWAARVTESSEWERCLIVGGTLGTLLGKEKKMGDVEMQGI
jgi:hypothetical protein